ARPRREEREGLGSAPLLGPLVGLDRRRRLRLLRPAHADLDRTARRGLAGRVSRAASALEEPGLERLLAVRADAVAAGVRRGRQDRVQLRADVMGARGVVQCDPGWEAV